MVAGIEDSVRDILVALGEDPDREGLVKTPERVARSYEFLASGYQQDPHEVIGDALFTEDYSEMIIVRDIDFFSLCEHHMLPFYGRAHVAYVPDKHIVGISKLARLVECYARRLQVQERMTSQIAGFIQDKLKPLGVGVVIRAEHMCMRMRGVQKPNSSVVTSSLLGVFQERDTRQEFMNLLS
ncbi:MAG TPA: GTP cyclohydrolase I FolE [Deltaproteobacteria bacterium]|nr:GTP cyclohydrolase I FolE [Candidatus Binatota bacterium]HIL12496.1 GTP cyclohydrolase I FolE [Deltaproteobacteria bacterium]